MLFSEVWFCHFFSHFVSDTRHSQSSHWSSVSLPKCANKLAAVVLVLIICEGSLKVTRVSHHGACHHHKIACQYWKQGLVDWKWQGENILPVLAEPRRWGKHLLGTTLGCTMPRNSLLQHNCCCSLSCHRQCGTIGTWLSESCNIHMRTYGVN